MAKRGVTTEKKKPSNAPVEAISQMFKIDQSTYMKVRTLAAARRGTGKAATGQDIYAEAIQEYLERYAAELDDAVTGV